MISPVERYEERHWGLTAAERAARGRRFAVAAAVVLGLVHAAAAVPVGLLWPVLLFAGFLGLVIAPLWLIGFLNAVGHRRRFPGPDATRAIGWWLFPPTALGATLAALDGGLPRRAAERLVAADLAALETPPGGAAPSLELLGERFVGPYPCTDVRRYPNGTVRLEFLGAGLFEGRRGLVHLPDGAPLPLGLEVTGEAVAGDWLPWLEEDGR